MLTSNDRLLKLCNKRLVHRKHLPYAKFLLNEIDPPLHDAEIENTVLIHLIKLYFRHRSDYLDKGLVFVQTGVERELAHELARDTKTSRLVHYLLEDVFEVTCIPKISPNAITGRRIIYFNHGNQKHFKILFSLPLHNIFTEYVFPPSLVPLLSFC